MAIHKRSENQIHRTRAESLQTIGSSEVEAPVAGANGVYDTLAPFAVEVNATPLRRRSCCGPAHPERCDKALCYTADPRFEGHACVVTR